MKKETYQRTANNNYWFGQFEYNFNFNFMAPFYGWGSNTDVIIESSTKVSVVCI